MSNDTLSEILQPHLEGRRTKALVYLDEGILDGNPNLPERIQSYFRGREERLNLVTSPIFIKGGEEAKNDWSLVERIWADLNQYAMCRHSYVIVVGGGAALDLVGFAASTAHRGVRQIRCPPTTHSQGDGGVGVKNGVNFFGKKNWVGTFCVPDAVVNDFNFLRGLPETKTRRIRRGRQGRVIRDRSFFEQIEEKAEELAQFEENALEQVIRKAPPFIWITSPVRETPSKKARPAPWTSVIGSPTSSNNFPIFGWGTAMRLPSVLRSIYLLRPGRPDQTQDGRTLPPVARETWLSSL